MRSKELEEQIIANYMRDEKMMILIFAQWCINNDLDPIKLYEKAYPDQIENAALKEAMDLTVPKSEAGEIASQTVLNVLSMFGNEELAFLVTEHQAKKN
ncbi:MAG TPA: hypothetical protein VLK78_04885 [Candidatus Angelobacter sp.]|nr:hypothetical protein [Candidatus Angelobacter sp.]